MPTRPLPSRPSLAQLKLQAKELHRDHRVGRRPAVARALAYLPQRAKQRGEVASGRRLTLGEAQLVVAREYGFRTWAALKHRVEITDRLATITPHPLFGSALAALDAGQVEELEGFLASDHRLARARTNLEPPCGYFTGATLLHHVAGNPRRQASLPANVVSIARTLLDAGADVNDATLGPEGSTTMGLLVTSKQANDAGVTVPLMELLLDYGATLDLERADALDAPLANYAPRAAEKMIALGAKPDVLAMAALGRIDLLRAAFDTGGRLRSRPRRRGRLMRERDAIGLAVLFAYVNDHLDVVDFLLEKDGNWEMTGVNNGTALHRAAWTGDLAMVQRLVAKGADIANRDNPFTSTPLAWAFYNKQQAVVSWMRSHCAIDLHDAVCMDMEEHVEARLREDSASANALRDQQDIPRCTSLHWAAWPYYQDVDGRHSHDPSRRERLVELLLARGADPNVVAGNGLTPLDIAHEAQAPRIAALLERHGGRRAAEL